MHAAVIHTLEVYARSIYSCGMEPEVAKYHLGALALLKAREQVISECISPLSPNDLDILGMLSERLLVANGFDKDGSVSLCHLCGYSRIAPSRGKAKPGRSPRWNVASEG